MVLRYFDIDTISLSSSCYLFNRLLCLFRYAISDLYKPHHSRVRSARRSSSPTHARPRTPEPERGAARRRAPIDEVNFGEAAKKSRQQSTFGGAERRTNMPRQRYSQPTRCFIYSTFPCSYVTSLPCCHIWAHHCTPAML